MCLGIINEFLNYFKQHEFEEGQNLEEAAIDGFLKPYVAFIKD